MGKIIILYLFIATIIKIPRSSGRKVVTSKNLSFSIDFILY